jgi:hypothetical protein
MGDELPAGGMFHRAGDAHLTPRPVRFALADASSMRILAAARVRKVYSLHAPEIECGYDQLAPEARCRASTKKSLILA